MSVFVGIGIESCRVKAQTYGQALFDFANHRLSKIAMLCASEYQDTKSEHLSDHHIELPLHYDVVDG